MNPFRNRKNHPAPNFPLAAKTLHRILFLILRPKPKRLRLTRI